MGNTKQPGALASVAIICVQMMIMGTSVITPAIATLQEHFVGFDVTFIQTIATLGVVVGTFIAGAIMGKYVRMKTLAIFGSACCLIFGILPVLFDNYWILIVDRALFGLALGLMAPLSNAMILSYYEGNKQSSMLGFATMAMNIGGIVFQQVSGALLGISWQAIFWTHLFFIVSLILSFFIPTDPKPTAETRAAAKEASKGGEKMNTSVVVVMGIVMFLIMMVNVACMVEASVLLADKGITNGNLIALALTFYTIAGMVGGAVFGPIYNALKRYTFILALACNAIACLIIYFCGNYAVSIIGFCLLGFGFNWMFASTNALMGIVNPPSKIGSSISVMTALMNFGGFVASFWIIAMGYNLMALFISDTIVSVILLVFMLFYNPAKKFQQAK